MVWWLYHHQEWVSLWKEAWQHTPVMRTSYLMEVLFAYAKAMDYGLHQLQSACVSKTKD